MKLNRVLKRIQFIAFDFDGVFTDNRVIVGQDGTESVICHRADGIGLAKLREYGIDYVVISTEVNPVVSKRCEKLEIPCFQGCKDKWQTLQDILSEKNIKPENTGYVGNDINDMKCLQNVGVPICTADAYPAVKSIAQLITKREGGDGAVREICDLIARVKKGVWSPE